MKTTNMGYAPQAPAAYQAPFASAYLAGAPVAPQGTGAAFGAPAGPAPQPAQQMLQAPQAQQMSQASFAPQIPQAPQAPQQTQGAPRSSERTERWLGEVVLGVLAALLILGGIVLLCSYFAPEAHAANFAIAALFSVAAGGVGIALAEKLPTSASVQRIKGLVALLTSEFMLFIAATQSAWNYSEMTALVIMALILIAVKLAPAPKALKVNETALRVNEIVVLFAAAYLFLLHGIAGGPSPLIAIVLAGIFTLCAAGLVALRALDLARPEIARPQSAFIVLLAAAFIAVLLGFVVDVAQLFTSPYAWSALCLVCALVCVGAGFWFGEKALRRFGLVLALVCVAKIVLVDISGDLFVHAIALIAGGLACLGISALYTFAARRFDS